MAATMSYLRTPQQVILTIMKVMRQKTAVLRQEIHQLGTPMIATATAATITMTEMIAEVALTMARVIHKEAVERTPETPTLR